MARQLALLPPAQVIATPLHAEMQRSYLEYAMSVIVGRALPDVRDGLKPVHRRILYAMHELGLVPDRPYRKCARVVGDVLGKYHPHGDQSVYDALVRMVQDFSSRYPLLAGHGNFGSVDNDPPAAMRYTETRLAPVSHEGLLSEIGEATVDFIDNFDSSQQEPVVLPAQLPYLLLNGCSGIAVGMATNVPPHNLNEIVDGLIALIDRPTLTDDALFKLIPGPDFPTGGEITDPTNIREAYETGRGSIPLRGICQVEEIQGGQGRRRRTAIVVTELPYQVNKAGWIKKVADLVNQNRINGITDIRDESDREGIRVVVELKRDADPQVVLYHLYKQSPLQTNFGAIFMAIVEGQPRQLPLREVLQQFLDFREQTLRRQYAHEQTQVENRRHIVEGLLIALTNLDATIDILRQAPDGTTAKQSFQDQLGCSERQADAILAMPLRRLTSLEQQGLREEFEQLGNRLQQLQRLLSNRKELLKALKKDLRALKKKYGDERRTRIAAPVDPEGSGSNPAAATVAAGGSADEDAVQLQPTLPDMELPEQEVVLELTQRGYIRRIPIKTYQRQLRSRSQSPTATIAEVDTDLILQTESTTTAREVLVLIKAGKAYSLLANDVPRSAGRNARGVPLVNLLPASVQGDPDAIASTLLLPADLTTEELIAFTQRGRIKRLALSELNNLTARGLTALKLKADDELNRACFASGATQVMLATSNGRLLRFPINDEQLPLSSRAAQGQQGIRIGKKEQLVGGVALNATDPILIVSAQGYVKRLPASAIRLASRGGIGTQSMQFTNKTDGLVGIVLATDGAEIALWTTNNRSLQIDAAAIALGSKSGTGDRLVELSGDERVLGIASHCLPSFESDNANEEEE